MAASNPIRFGQIVQKRREELGLTQDDIAAAGGPSDTTLTRIEKGLGASRPSTRRSLDKPLRWKPGSAADVWAGGDPTPLEATTSERRPKKTSGATMVLGPDQAPVSLTVLTELLQLNSRLWAYAAEHPDSTEIATISRNLSAVVSTISGEWVTETLERNAGPDRSVSPMIEFAFAAHLSVPVDLDDPDADEKLYRRWLIGKDDQLTEERSAAFRARFARR